jgi:hypothetical protein
MILALAFSLKGMANPKFYNHSFLGEKKSSHFYGTSYPKLKQDYFQGELFWNEKIELSKYMDTFHFKQSNTLENFFFNELRQAMICPNSTLAKNVEYIRFTYRLLAISYLYEAINDYQVTLTKLGRNSDCKVNWRKTFKRCSAKSRDMKKYKKTLVNLNHFYKNRLDKKKKYSHFSKSWLKDLDEGDGETISHVRMYTYYDELDTETDDYTKSEHIENLNNICGHDLSLLKDICSENDRLYGISNTTDALDLLSASNIINVFNQGGHGKGCLERYSGLLSNKEEVITFLPDLFSIIREKLLLKYGDSYIQGKIFVPGSFKEFEDKGLLSVYETVPVKKVKLKKQVKIKVEKEKIIVVNQKISLKTPIKKLKRKILKKVKKKILKKKFISSFLLTAQTLYKEDLPVLSVPMIKFKYDYVFSYKMVQALRRTLKEYISIKALKEMKQYNSLGEVNGPVPLVFIKYLIDTNNHKGLYNLLNVVGDRFYVKNDIDRNLSLSVNYIQLRNDLSTGQKWVIDIINDLHLNKNKKK